MVFPSVCACDFVACCEVAQPTISHHLKVLRKSGWVRAERRRSFVYYHLRPDAVARFNALAGQSVAGPAIESSVAGPSTGRLTVRRAEVGIQFVSRAVGGAVDTQPRSAPPDE